MLMRQFPTVEQAHSSPPPKLYAASCTEQQTVCVCLVDTFFDSSNLILSLGEHYKIEVCVSIDVATVKACFHDLQLLESWFICIDMMYHVMKHCILLTAFVFKETFLVLGATGAAFEINNVLAVSVSSNHSKSWHGIWTIGIYFQFSQKCTVFSFTCLCCCCEWYMHIKLLHFFWKLLEGKTTESYCFTMSCKSLTASGLAVVNNCSAYIIWKNTRWKQLALLVVPLYTSYNCCLKLKLVLTILQCINFSILSLLPIRNLTV